MGTGRELDIARLTGLDDAAIAAAARPHYTGEASCAAFLRDRPDLTSAEAVFIDREGLGVFYAFNAGAAESCGARPVIILVESVRRALRVHGPLRRAWAAGAGEGTASRPDPTPAIRSVSRLPAALLGAFARQPAGCTSDYGPLVVEPTRFDFGWGRARFASIMREGSSYEIEAELISEGQINGPEREQYVIAAQPDGTGIRLTMGGKRFDYEPC